MHAGGRRGEGGAKVGERNERAAVGRWGEAAARRGRLAGAPLLGRGRGPWRSARGRAGESAAAGQSSTSRGEARELQREFGLFLSFHGHLTEI